jgi:RNA polymerase sigma-70 factor (sigma-E family)
VTVQRLASDPLAPTSLAPQGQDGFEQFVAATADRLYRSALLLCGDHHLAEDLTQTTYARVFSRWSTVSMADSPLAYTRTVLMRAFLAHHRLRRSSERPVDVVPELALEGPDAAVRVDLLAALARLSRRDRAVLVLRYWEDFSVARTAEVLGIPESTCRNRAARALVRLRALLPDVTEPDDENGELS